MPKTKKTEEVKEVKEVKEEVSEDVEEVAEETSSDADLYESLKELVLNMEVDRNKFYNKGNAAAGTRVRSSCQQLKKLAQDLRVDIQTRKNSKKTEST